MAMKDDFDRLDEACANLLDRVAAAQKHKPAEWIRWRLSRLKQEIFEFKSVVFPNGRTA